MALAPWPQSAMTVGIAGVRFSVVYQTFVRVEVFGRLKWFITIAVRRQSGAAPVAVRS